FLVRRREHQPGGHGAGDPPYNKTKESAAGREVTDPGPKAGTISRGVPEDSPENDAVKDTAEGSDEDSADKPRNDSSRRRAFGVHEERERIMSDYPSPVDRLLTLGNLGDLEEFDDWHDYLKLGLGPEHIPDLIRMAVDPALNDADPGG